MISEKLSRSDPISVWIDDFLNSKDPRFAGKTRKQRRQMALGAYFGYNTESQTETKMQEKYDTVEILALEDFEQLEENVFFHANPKIKNPKHLLAIQHILASAGAAGRKVFSGSKLASVTKKIHDKAGIGNDVWDHIHTSRVQKESVESTETVDESFEIDESVTLVEFNEYFEITESDVDALAEMLGKSMAECGSLQLGEGFKSFKDFFKEPQDVKPAELTKFVKQSVKKQGEAKE